MMNKIKELAKKLCDESGCHHKCKEIDECVVMEEAELLINQDKSNNFDVKSNNELVPKRNELPFVLTNEENVSVKDRCIEEMGEYMAYISHSECAIKSCDDCKWSATTSIEKADCTDYLIAEHLYNAGYRKQSEVIEEYRQKVNVKMGKHTHLLGKEYVQRILREVAKEMKGGESTDKAFFSPNDVRRMSPREVKENYDLIIESMKRW